MKTRRIVLTGVVLAGALIGAQPAPIFDYIRQTWGVLTRSHQTLAAAAVDPKLHPDADGKWPVYVSRTESIEQIQSTLAREMTPAAFRTLAIRSLPPAGRPISEEGLLYLPQPYVVPGGRFNEMYGWDSYFIQMGLLRDGMTPLARDMTDNFLYEIRHYGKILNANRTYYLSRSQPPFLTEMLLSVYRKTHDRKWLQDALPAALAYYQFWTGEPHLTRETGLSRYFDLGDGPAPEVIISEGDAGERSYYDRARDYFRTHNVQDYDASEYYDAAANQLTPLFYKGDRSMRESGFDLSDRFGPFGVDIIHYDPVCLNTLLYLMETQMAEISGILGHSHDQMQWTDRASRRATLINQLMWNTSDGLYEDYDFVHRHTRRYPFLTTFYPLWAGIASREQAARVEANLPLFEQPGGLETSTTQSGEQWDAPFGWAPLEYIAVEGLRRYGYRADADRISQKFLSMIEEQYRQSGRIVEKYDVTRRSANLTGQIYYGYSSNEAGFGWTNAVFTALSDQLTDPHAGGKESGSAANSR